MGRTKWPYKQTSETNFIPLALSAGPFLGRGASPLYNQKTKTSDASPRTFVATLQIFPDWGQLYEIVQAGGHKLSKN